MINITLTDRQAEQLAAVLESELASVENRALAKTLREILRKLWWRVPPKRKKSEARP